ncbi:MAG: cell division protein FtsL [Acidobacteriota bacterium]
MRKKKAPIKLIAVVALVSFLLLFTYSSLNLKNIDYGYEEQKLLEKERILKEEIDILNARRSRLLDLERVEKIAQKKLGYVYPEKKQIIKVIGD